jgi:hypothetical protein
MTRNNYATSKFMFCPSDRLDTKAGQLSTSSSGHCPVEFLLHNNNTNLAFQCQKHSRPTQLVTDSWIYDFIENLFRVSLLLKRYNLFDTIFLTLFSVLILTDDAILCSLPFHGHLNND